jgi:hypothetical protein
MNLSHDSLLSDQNFLVAPKGLCTYCVHPDRSLAVLGGIQAVGAVLVAASYVAPRKRLVRAQVTLAPVPIGHDGYGLSLSGRL